MLKNVFKKVEGKFNKSKRWAKFGQFMYLTVHGFNIRNLWESAYSCSFGFVFSFVPILLIIVSILAYILRASPAAVNYVYAICEEFKDIFDFTPFVNSVVHAQRVKISVVNVILTGWTIWMSRRLFLSLVFAMNRIFKSRSMRKNLFNQVLMFVSEFALIFIVVLVIVISFVLNRFLTTPFFSGLQTKFPKLLSNGSNLILTIVIYFILFIFVALVYRFISGTAPRLRSCFFFSFINAGTFYVLTFFLNKIDTSNYNLVYGTISTIIVLIAKIYFFFVVFLFCAEMLYVKQFFNALLRAEVYLRPDTETRNFDDLMRKVLFINPAAILNDDNTKEFKAGEVIYRKGDSPEFVYYVCSGIIREESEQGERLLVQGAFVGEISCILNQKLKTTAVAVKDSKVMVFTEEEFMSFLHENPRAASKALNKVTVYSSKLYTTEVEYDDFPEERKK